MIKQYRNIILMTAVLIVANTISVAASTRPELPEGCSELAAPAGLPVTFHAYASVFKYIGGMERRGILLLLTRVSSPRTAFAGRSLSTMQVRHGKATVAARLLERNPKNVRLTRLRSRGFCWMPYQMMDTVFLRRSVICSA